MKNQMTMMSACRQISFLLSFTILPIIIHRSNALDNGLGLTPPMGWNSWNVYACNINETIIYENAVLIQTLGFADLGYEYVNVDDCWMDHHRTPDGHLVGDPETFPSGMKALADKVHDLGLKFGLYSSAGTMTCERRPGSLGREEMDARTFAEWDVDYLKYDNCYNQHVPGPERYTAMRDALLNSGRKIFYSICSWGTENVAEWGKDVGNSWRTTDDIKCPWSRIRQVFETNERYFDKAGPGGWNDPDMLYVGNHCLSIEQERTHFALWCIVKAPLLIGCSLKELSDASRAILQNQHLIALNQDSAGKQGSCIRDCDSDQPVYSVYASDMGGYWGVVVPNWSEKDTKEAISIQISEVVGDGYGGFRFQMVDMWTGDVLKQGMKSTDTYSFNITGYDCMALKIVKVFSSLVDIGDALAIGIL